MHAGAYMPEKKFDLVFMSGVLHHFQRMRETPTKIVGFVRPGGWVLANEPQSANLFIRFARALRAKVDNSYSSEHLQFSVLELRELYERVGLQNIIIQPQGIFSTLMAEIIMHPQKLFTLVAKGAVLMDNLLDKALGGMLTPVSWNLIAAGQVLPQ